MLDDIVKRKYWQRLKTLSFEHFCDAQNDLHTVVYELAIQHMIESMSIHPKITKKTMAEVSKRAAQIRDEWDGCYEITTFENTLEKMIEQILEKKYGITKEKAI